MEKRLHRTMNDVKSVNNGESACRNWTTNVS